ncbi:hypothetical protein [Martelella sp. HB161492]|uniref:hypothetical protein n=1 Tax=Martelella sp. HB161492 TaxID=2720726 RepID=UPI001591C122|nr:hypothetical protein [Martelella sp. HB161492]
MLKQRPPHAATAIATLGLIATLAAAPAAMSAEQPDIPAGQPITSWVENGQNGRYLLQREDGELPEGTAEMTGVVLSDSNCAPDSDNINHCRNEIRLENGRVITGIDNHRMSVNRCLRQGETVTVSALNDAWFVVLTKAAMAN